MNSLSKIALNIQSEFSKSISYFWCLLILVLLLNSCGSQKSGQISADKSNEFVLLKVYKIDSLMELNEKLTFQLDSIRLSNTFIKIEKDSVYREFLEQWSYNDTLIAQNRDLSNQVLLAEDEYSYHQEGLIMENTSNEEIIPQKAEFNINSGKIGFYCPKKMIYKETYDAFGFVKDLVSNENLKKIIKKKLIDHIPDTSNIDLNDPSVLIDQIDFYDELELTLEDPTNSMEIIRQHEKDKQNFSNNMEGWHWKIIPNSSSPKQSLVVKLKSFDANGNQEFSFDKTYHIAIHVNHWRLLHNAQEFYIENPEATVTTLLIPFLTFLYGRFSKKSKNKNS